MQAHLWIMRHAAAGPTTDAKNDDKRPLDAEGVLQAKAAAIAFKKLRTPIQTIMSSPLTRAEQTAEPVAKALGLEVKVEPLLSGTPMPLPLLNQITRGRGNCLLVTHAPVCNLIVFNRTGAQIQLAKGGAVQMHEGEVWTLLNPSTFMVMADMVAFKDPQDVDHRSRDDERHIFLSGRPQPHRYKLGLRAGAALL